ncbi:MAG: hypothetical protein ACRDWY_18970, partial [Actinomycetes bacterium]
AFRNARLAAELAHQVHELDQRTRELAESRRRLITAGDAERARVERSIAQRVAPHLRPLPAQLDQLANSGPAPVQPTALAPLVTASATALEELREITRGVFPTQLARSGLEAALRSYLGRSDTGRLTVADSAAGRRFDRSVEAAAYFVVVEAAGELAPPVEVALRAPEDRLEIVVNGQARGVLPLANIRDRVEATGGSMSQRTGGGHSIVEVRLPAQAPVAAAVRQ